MSDRHDSFRHTRVSKCETLRREEVRREKYARATDCQPVDFSDPFEFDENEILDLAESIQCGRERVLFS